MVTVNDAALIAKNGAGATAIEGAAITTTVATFTDANPAATATDFAGTMINWGDGSGPTAATVTLSGGIFSVTGTHTYADEGGQTATASILDDGGATASASDPVTVNDAALTATNGAGMTATEGTAVTTTVATFTDANPAATTADFAGTTIDWGDGSTIRNHCPGRGRLCELGGTFERHRGARTPTRSHADGHGASHRRRRHLDGERHRRGHGE